MAVPPGMTAGLGDLVHLQAVDLALGGEEQHVGVRGSHKQVLHEVGVLQVHALHALGRRASAGGRCSRAGA